MATTVYSLRADLQTNKPFTLGYSLARETVGPQWNRDELRADWMNALAHKLYFRILHCLFSFCVS